MDELIYKQPLLNAMDKRYNEKVNIVPDNLAEGFMQMEKLIKEQQVITKQQIEEEAINRFVATLLPRLTDAIYPKDVESMTNLIKSVASEVRDNDNMFFNFDNPVVNVDQKSYLKGYRQGLDEHQQKDSKKRVINKCYARNCSNNNIDNTCMYGDASQMPCQVNCCNCVYNCKKTAGEKACVRFERVKESVADE